MSYDVILFGATSFVGQITAGYLAKRVGTDRDVKWAIAGRNPTKLHDVALETGATVPELIVDAGDDAAVRKMVSSTKLVISTVGPYANYGTGVVAACAESGTDYCDLSGEPHWMAQMIDDYQAQASASGARIVHACGFDSIPSDLGVWFLQRHCADLYSQPAQRVELIVKAMKGGASGGTIASMMNMMEELSEDPSLRKVLTNPYALAPEGARSGIRQPNPNRVREHHEENLWLAPFVMAATNSKIVHRSHALLGAPWGDFEYSEEMATGEGPLGAVKAGALAAGLGGFMALASIGPTRSVLNRFVLPAPGEGPSPEAQENGFFKIILRGSTLDGDVVRVQVTGDRDPGYGSTAKMLSESALTLARTPQKVTPGGFWTPSTAMGDSLIDALTEHAGLSFTLL
ncbi:MAG: saccharopine dehydrogenase family protein [Acidimicrobiales bacterium]